MKGLPLVLAAAATVALLTVWAATRPPTPEELALRRAEAEGLKAVEDSKALDRRIVDMAMEKHNQGKRETERADAALERARVRVGNALADAEGKP